MNRLHTALFCCSVLSFCCILPAQTVAVVETSPDLKIALQSRPGVSFGAPVAGPTQIEVDSSQRFQTMDGFGAAMTDSSAWLIADQLTEAQQEDVMQKLFDPERGIGISFLRVPVGASDLARNLYTYDDLPPGQADPALTRFSVAHDEAYILPVLRHAFKLNPSISLMLTPWSPPAWMKTNDSVIGGHLHKEASASFAAYLVRSVEAYQSAGIPVRYISLQNEPLYEPKDYPGTFMPAEQEAELISNYVGPALAKSHLKAKVLAYDHNWNNPEYATAVLSNEHAAKYVAGSAFHCYAGDPSAQREVHDQFPAKGVWMTECSGGTWQKGNLLAVTEDLVIESVRHWSKAVVLWGLALDQDNGPHSGGCATCRGLVTVNRSVSPHTVTYTTDYYAVGHASRFVHPGAVRIASTEVQSVLETAAFQNPDGSIVLLVLNKTGNVAEFAVNWQGKAFNASLDAGSVATYVWRSSIHCPGQ